MRFGLEGGLVSGIEQSCQIWMIPVHCNLSRDII